MSFLFPVEAKSPSLSNLKLEFCLTQESIKQLPGPISLLVKPYEPTGFLIIVIFEIPPIFRIQVGKSNLNLVAIN